MAGVPKPPDDRRCEALMKRNGKRCPNWSTGTDENGRRACVSHGGAGASLVRRDPAAAQQRRNEVQARKKAQLEREERLRSLGLREQVRARIEERSAEIVDTLMKLSQHEDPQVALRAISALWDRSYGRPVTPSIQVSDSLSQAAVAEIKESVGGLSSEERLALAREKLGLSGPRQIQDGDVVDDAE